MTSNLVYHEQSFLKDGSIYLRNLKKKEKKALELFILTVISTALREQKNLKHIFVKIFRSR